MAGYDSKQSGQIISAVGSKACKGISKTKTAECSGKLWERSLGLSRCTTLSVVMTLNNPNRTGNESEDTSISAVLPILYPFSQTFPTIIWASWELCYGAAMSTELSFALMWNPLNFCQWGYIWKSTEKQSMSKNIKGLEVFHFRRLDHSPKKKAEYWASLLSQNIHIVHADPKILISEDAPNIKRYNDLFFQNAITYISCNFFYVRPVILFCTWYVWPKIFAVSLEECHMWPNPIIPSQFKFGLEKHLYLPIRSRFLLCSGECIHT